jgi:alanine racemase
MKEGDEMFGPLRPVWAEIDLDNLKHNITEIKRITKAKEIIAVVKADAYGHGALDTVPLLLENGASRVAVAVITEALELRQGGVEAPIIILGYTPLDFIKEITENDFEVTVCSYEYAEALSEQAKQENKTIKIHIKLDTGMGRFGFLPTEKSVEDVYKISKLSNIVIEGLFSHFSSADERDKSYTYKQIRSFNNFYNKLKKLGININIKHIANSAALIDMPEVHLDAVRPGIILYGYYPSCEVCRERIDLKPVMTLKTSVVHVKNVPCGEYISYGRRFKTDRESCIATLPVGYADGYTRLLFNKGKVIVNGGFAPVVGRICMDACMIDVTDVGDVKPGDEVVLMGESAGLKFTAEDIAELLGTISYEIVCMISKRVPRVYIKDGNIVKIRNYV